MPGMSGWEVAEAVKGINPKVPVAIITGWNVDLQESEMKGRGVDLIAYKPFEVNRVLALVQEGMKIQEVIESCIISYFCYSFASLRILFSHDLEHGTET